MKPPPGVNLTGPEVQQMRRDMLEIDYIAADLRAGRPLEGVLIRLGGVASDVRFLLDRAEERRGIH
ncbi:hypothetical protein [Luteitalea sp.]